RGIGVGLDLELLRRVDGRDERDLPSGTHARDAVDQDLVFLRAAAADRHAGAAGDVQWAQIAPGVLLDHARREPGELKRVTAGGGEVEDLLVRYDQATARRIGVVALQVARV